MGIVAKADLSPQERAEFEVLESMGEDIEGCLMLRFKRGKTALQIALEMRDDPSIIHGLAAANADMNAVMPIGTSALVFALMNAKIKSAKALIACGANVNDSDSPLLYAVTAEDEETIKILIERGANVNDGGRYIMTPLHAACQIRGSGREKIIRMLIEAGADRTLRNASGETAADLCPSVNVHFESIEMAAKHGITLGNPRNRNGGAL
jgi:ankyrin repeat protein